LTGGGASRLALRSPRACTPALPDRRLPRRRRPDPRSLVITGTLLAAGHRWHRAVLATM